MSERPCGAPWPFLILLIAFPFKGGNVALMQRACSAIVRNHAFQTRRPVRRVNRKITGQGNVWQRNGKRRWRHYSFAIPFSFGFLKSKSRQFTCKIFRGLAAFAPPEISSGGRSAATPKFQISLASLIPLPIIPLPVPVFSMARLMPALAPMGKNMPGRFPAKAGHLRASGRCCSRGGQDALKQNPPKPTQMRPCQYRSVQASTSQYK